MAGRSSGSKNAVNNENKVKAEIATEDVVIKSKTEAEIENELLKRQLEEMRAMIESMQKRVDTTVASPTDEPLAVISNDVLDMNARISVTSITTGGVNLRTATDGTAKIFRFEKLGQSLPILYIDLINCINLNRSFFEEGLIYINNQKAIEDNYLEDFYKKFLTIDKINNILNFDIDTIKSMVSNTTVAIQETICLVIAEKLNRGEAVDMNKVDIVGKSCKQSVDLRDLANKIR